MKYFTEEEKIKILSSHMDVVSLGEKKEWTSDPFTLIKKGRKIIRTWNK